MSSTKRAQHLLAKDIPIGKMQQVHAFQKHQQSHRHREAIEVVIVLPKVSTDVGELLIKP